MRGSFYSWARETTSKACQFNQTETVVNYTKAVQCYKSFQLGKFEVEDTIQSLQRISDFYIHSPFVTNNTEYPLKINIRKSLKEIGKISYDNQWEFYTKLTKFYNNLQDFSYNFESTCFNTFTFIQPFPLIANVIKKDYRVLKIYNKEIYEPEIKKFYAKLGYDLNQFNGATVLRIENKDPWEYLDNYVKDYVGVSYDNNARINLALIRPVQQGGHFGINYGAFMSTALAPPKSTINFMLKLISGKIQIVSVPYVTKLPKNYNNKINFKNQYCKYKSDWKKESTLPNSMTRIDKIISQNNFKNINILFQGKFSSLLKFQHNVIVFKLNSISIDNRSYMVKELKEILNIINIKLPSKLILDLSSTLGTDLCFAKAILFKFIPDSKIKIVSDILFNDLWENVNKDKPNKVLKSMEFLKNISKHSVFHQRRGNDIRVNLSAPFVETCPNNILQTKLLFNATKNNTFIVTDSICFQACAILVNSFQHHHIPTLVFSASYNKTIVATSMPSLRSMSSTQLEYMLVSSESNHRSLALRPLRRAIHHRFAFQEEYLITSYGDLFKDSPLQFQHYYTKLTIPITKKMVHFYYRWKAIVDYLSTLN